MKRVLAIILSCTLVLYGCTTANTSDTEVNSTQDSIAKTDNTEEVMEFIEITDEEVSFNNLNDPELLQYVEDSIYADLSNDFGSDDYVIQDISTTYISKEYLEELEYNSKENIYFGYTLSEINAQFEGTRYVFTLGEDGNTVVQAFQNYDDTYEQIIKNVAVGTGVILVCVTVSVISGGVGASTVSVVFAASAKTGTSFALSSSVFSGVTSGLVTQFQTGDAEQALKSAALTASEGFMWGAIGGSIAGGTEKALTLYKDFKTVPTFRESELRALEKYGGVEQVSYFEGKEVSLATQNATRPDIVRYTDGILEAVEVKNYNLNSEVSRNALYNELKRQVSERVTNLPAGSTQRIVLDVKGRGYSDDLLQSVIQNIRVKCADVYPNIPIDIMY